MTEPPIDKGWAWMCVLGAATCNFMFTGTLRSFGIVILEVMEKFNCGAATASLMIGLMSVCLSIFSPIMNALSERYTYRRVVMLGGLTFGVSYLLLSIAPSHHVAIFTTGVIGGVGFCSIFGPPLVVVGQYFDKRRSFANGLTTGGGSLGQLSLPLFTRYLLDTYGFTGAFLVFGAFALHTVPAAALFRPMSQYTSKSSDNGETKYNEKVENTAENADRLEKHPANDDNQSQAEELVKHKLPVINIEESRPLVQSKSEDTGLNDSTHSLHLPKTRVNQLKKASSHSTLKYWKGSVNSLNPLKLRHPLHSSTASLSLLAYQKPPTSALGQDEWEAPELPVKDLKAEEPPRSSTKDQALATFCCLCTSVPAHTKPWLEWSLFKNYLFIIYICGMCMGNSGVVSSCVYLPPRAVDIGVDKRNAALLLTIVGACDFVGRIFGGWFADLGYIKRHKIMTVTLLVTGVTTLICNQVETYESFVVLACVLGLIGGTYIALFVVLLVDFVGLEKLSSASGLAIMCLGMFNVPLPSIIGAIKDVTGSFKMAYVMLGCITIAAGLSYSLEPIARRLEERKAAKQDMQTDNPIYKPPATKF